MNSQDFNNAAVTVRPEDSLMNGISWFYAQFMQGDIDEHEFSDLIDLHIELDHGAVA